MSKKKKSKDEAETADNHDMISTQRGRLVSNREESSTLTKKSEISSKGGSRERERGGKRLCATHQRLRGSAGCITEKEKMGGIGALIRNIRSRSKRRDGKRNWRPMGPVILSKG